MLIQFQNMETGMSSQWKWAQTGHPTDFRTMTAIIGSFLPASPWILLFPSFHCFHNQNYRGALISTLLSSLVLARWIAFLRMTTYTPFLYLIKIIEVTLVNESHSIFYYPKMFKRMGEKLCKILLGKLKWFANIYQSDHDTDTLVWHTYMYVCIYTDTFYYIVIRYSSFVLTG